MTWFIVRRNSQTHHPSRINQQAPLTYLISGIRQETARIPADVWYPDFHHWTLKSSQLNINSGRARRHKFELFLGEYKPHNKPQARLQYKCRSSFPNFDLSGTNRPQSNSHSIGGGIPILIAEEFLSYHLHLHSKLPSFPLKLNYLRYLLLFIVLTSNSIPTIFNRFTPFAPPTQGKA